MNDMRILDSHALGIRTAEASDETVWRDLWAAYLRFYKEELPEKTTAATWRRILDPAEPFGCFLAVRDRTMAGFANYVVHPSTWNARPACLMEDLFVRPEARGQGAGRALIERLIVEARRMSCAKLYWITQQDNAIARRLYETIVLPDGFIQYTIEFGETRDASAD